MESRFVSLPPNYEVVYKKFARYMPKILLPPLYSLFSVAFSLYKKGFGLCIIKKREYYLIN